MTATPNITYPQLCDALTARFEPAEQAPVHEAGFRMRQKHADETQFAFAAALRSLAERAFRGQNGPLLDCMILQQFTEGQPSREIRLDLLSNRPATLDEAVQKTISIEAAYRIEASRGSTVSSMGPMLDTAMFGTQQVAAAASLPQDQSAALLQTLQSIERKLDHLSFTAPHGRGEPDQPWFQQPSQGRGRGRGNTRVGSAACFFCKATDHFIASCPELERVQAIASHHNSEN